MVRNMYLFKIIYLSTRYGGFKVTLTETLCDIL